VTVLKDTSVMIDLDERYLDEVREILHHHVPHAEVRAFGSRVQGNARRFSDLDLALVGVDDLDWRAVEALKDAFAESDLPFRVDVVLWRQLPESLRASVESHHVLVQAHPY
jgi:type I restriction enzyme S subunit